MPTQNEGDEYILFINADDTSRHASSANTAIYPNLGLLTLMSALKPRVSGTGASLGYLDGTVHGNAALEAIIDAVAPNIRAICFSALTANYGASVALARRVKSLNRDVLVIFGNDHFSALHDRIMANQEAVDAGFCGNDVALGFCDFVADQLAGRLRPTMDYAGLVYRDGQGAVHRNPEDPREYGQLPLVDYGLMDSLMPHEKHYLDGQQQVYFFMREQGLRSMVVDIGRGCVKFAGQRLDGVPLNACDFCGIIPGTREIVAPEAGRAWAVLGNAYRQGFNYFYLTADELPLTMWRMIRDMAGSPPSWYSGLPESQRPKMFGYARAEAFSTVPERIDVMVNKLGINHFFVGFDGLSETSLLVMNKQPAGGRGRFESPMDHNLRALHGVSQRNGMVTAGLVLTHLGITPQLMAENYATLADVVEGNPAMFAALDFGPLCPIPGSMSYRYLTHPEYAEDRARQFGLRVDRKYLDSRSDFYLHADELDMDEMVRDFILGCCPEISPGLVDEYIDKTTHLAVRHGIVVGGGV